MFFLSLDGYNKLERVVWLHVLYQFLFSSNKTCIPVNQRVNKESKLFNGFHGFKGFQSNVLSIK